MKKILLFGMASMCFLSTYAQQNNRSVMTQTKKEINNLGNRTTPTTQLHPKQHNRSSSRWFEIVDAVDKTTGGGVFGDFANTVNTGLIWQDSTMKALYGNGSGGVVQEGIWIKSVGQVLDPAAMNFNSLTNYPGEIAFSRGNAYTVDSFGVYGIYERNPSKTTVVDTLILSFASSAELFSWSETQAAVIGNYGVDTIKVADYDFNMGTYSIDGTTTITKKIPLTAASVNDTIAGGWNYFMTPVGLSVAATGANIAGVTVTFKSGDTWIPNVDSAGSGTNILYNRFRFVSFEEAANTFRTYTKGDYNCSMLTKNDTTGWGMNAIPSYYFTSSSFGYELHWMDWKLTCATCNTPTAITNSTLNQINISAYPNPTSDNVTFSLNLLEKANNVSIEITDAVGQVIKTVNVGSINANVETKSTISVKELPTGMYFYSINADGQKVSNKLMIK